MHRFINNAKRPLQYKHQAIASAVAILGFHARKGKIMQIEINKKIRD